MRQSEIRSYLGPKDVRPLVNFDAAQYRDLARLGIGLDTHLVNEMAKKFYAMDSLQPTVTTASITTPVQFLQNWLPGFVRVITAARKIDDLVGIQITGAWEDEQIVQGVLEPTGSAIPYGDWSNVPLDSWNTNFNTRTVVRMEQGLKVGNLEAARSARMMVDDAGVKRQSAALALEIQRNQIGFFGFNAGGNNTYGFLNDPGLPNYVIVAAGASTNTAWSTKTFLEIQRDLLTGLVQLRTQSQDVIDPEKVDITLAVATASVDFLSTTSDFGISVREWLREAYPRVRVVSAPQLNAAHSNENVFYMYADRIEDESTDGGATWIQAVPAKFQVMGVLQGPKYFEEDYSNATAGVMCKRPYAVVRYYGI